MKINLKSKVKLEKQLRDLVVARLSVIPRNLQIAIGSDMYSIDELVKSVQDRNKVGKQIATMQIQYLKDLASGEIYKKFDDQQ